MVILDRGESSHWWMLQLLLQKINRDVLLGSFLKEQSENRKFFRSCLVLFYVYIIIFVQKRVSKRFRGRHFTK